jgi:hypothetical protein
MSPTPEPSTLETFLGGKHQQTLSRPFRSQEALAGAMVGGKKSIISSVAAVIAGYPQE